MAHVVLQQQEHSTGGSHGIYPSSLNTFSAQNRYTIHELELLLVSIVMNCMQQVRYIQVLTSGRCCLDTITHAI